MKQTVAGAVLLVVLSACGGGRPSQDDIAESISDDTEISGATADCLARILLDSVLSDDALQALVDGDEDAELSPEDEAALAQVYSEGLTVCIGR